jgi:uncharacterized protein YehS (DUF1456 family)
LKSNDILRRVRFIFNFDDSKMIALMSSADEKVTRAQISNWLKRDDDPEQVALTDSQLALFLNNFIESKRGKREGPKPPLEKRLNNNQVFMKMKIALSLQAEDVLDILAKANFKMSKHELSAFFRKPGHKHYRECKDQILRNFLHGLQVIHRPDKIAPSNSTVKTTAKKPSAKKPSAAKPSSAGSSNVAPPAGYQWKKKPDTKSDTDK